MLTIYGVYRSRASRNIWLADELGVPFRHVPVIQQYRQSSGPGLLHTRSPGFLKINPNGHVPSIEDDGLVLHESLAINLYLAKKHGGPPAPATVVEDGQMSMWSLWAATEVETLALQVLYNRLGNPNGPKDEAVARAVDRSPARALRRARQGACRERLAGRWPLHRRGHQRRGGRALRDGRSRSVRSRAEREGVAGRLPGAAGLQGHVGQTRRRAGVEPAR